MSRRCQLYLVDGVKSRCIYNTLQSLPNGADSNRFTLWLLRRRSRYTRLPVRKSKLKLDLTAALILGLIVPARQSFAQGCIVSRSGLESSGAEGGGYLRPGDWTASAGFRHVYSHVHFSGPTENISRAQLGTEVQTKTNLDDVVVNYQLTPRISLTGTLPFLYASRRLQSQYGTLYTSGISDISVGAAAWLRKPSSSKSSVNNAQFGLSLLMPTGSDHQSNVVATSYGATPTTQYPDYSVQPGGGTWGMIMSWQAFQSVGNNTVLYVTTATT